MAETKEKKYELIQNTLDKKKKSKFSAYSDLIVGKPGLFSMLKYEIITAMFAEWPGAVGIFLRSIFYRFIFKKVGKGLMIAKSVTLRHPHKISLGNNVIIDENVMLDAKGVDNNGIDIGDGVFLGRNTIISCKNGDVILHPKVNLGFNSYIVSLNRVEVGQNTLFAAYTYVIGGGHISDEIYIPLRDQDTHGLGIKIGRDSWLGAKSMIMDGCNVGDYCIIGAGAIVTKDIPDYSIAVGTPARVVKDRRAQHQAT
ncbi:MAG: acyltransferase [Actinobacteria bacterium]|nr:acyltransferase [Actinomycetota bacterium]